MSGNTLETDSQNFHLTKRQIGLMMLALTTAGLAGGVLLRQHLQKVHPEIEDPIYDIIANVARVASQDDANRMANFYFPSIIRSICDSADGDFDRLAQRTSRFIHQAKEIRTALSHYASLQSELGITDPQHASAVLGQMEQFVQQGVRNSVARTIKRSGIHIEHIDENSRYWNDAIHFMNEQWDR